MPYQPSQSTMKNTFLTKVGIKYKKGAFASITLTTVTAMPDGTPWFESTKTSYEEPTGQIDEALNKLLDWAIKTAHLDISWLSWGFASGLSIKWDSGEVAGYCATVQHRDPNTGAVQCVTTRFKGFDEITPTETAIIDEVCRHCLSYLDGGDRKVQQLGLSLVGEYPMPEVVNA